MKALVVGHSEPAAALTSALREKGVDARLHAVPSSPGQRTTGAMAEALTTLERRLEEECPRVAVGVGAGDAPLALAVSAAKLGIPFVAWVDSQNDGGSSLEQGERRVLATLASLDVGPVGEGEQAFQAAERIAAFAREGSSEPSDSDLD